MNQSVTTDKRKELRNSGTPAEASLWKMLKNKQIEGLKFRRQHNIGPYIIDFYCPQVKLAIELDGEVHANSAATDYDEKRTIYLENEAGVTVLRFENCIVFSHPELIMKAIVEFVAGGSSNISG